MLYEPYNSQPASLTSPSLRHTLKASCSLDMTEIKANTSVHDREFSTYSRMDLGNSAALCLLDSLDSKQFISSPPQSIRYNTINYNISTSVSDVSSEEELSPPKSARRLVSQLNLTSLFTSPPNKAAVSAPTSSNKKSASKRPSRNLSNFFKLGSLIEDLMLEPKLCANDICYTCSTLATDKEIQNALESTPVDSEFACLNDSIFLQLDDIPDDMVLSS